MGIFSDELFDRLEGLCRDLDLIWFKSDDGMAIGLVERQHALALTANEKKDPVGLLKNVAFDDNSILSDVIIELEMAAAGLVGLSGAIEDQNLQGRQDQCWRMRDRLVALRKKLQQFRSERSEGAPALQETTDPVEAIVRSLAHDSAHEKAREIICDIRADVAAKYKRQERDLCPVRIGDRMYYEPCAGSPEE